MSSAGARASAFELSVRQGCYGLRACGAAGSTPVAAHELTRIVTIPLFLPTGRTVRRKLAIHKRKQTTPIASATQSYAK